MLPKNWKSRLYSLKINDGPEPAWISCIYFSLGCVLALLFHLH